MKPEAILVLVTVLSSLLTFFLAFNVGNARRKNNASALEKTKNMDVIVANRVHMNMVENVVVFIPLLWVAAGVSTGTSMMKYVSIVGAIWFISRVVYSYMYLKNPEKRQIPFIVGVACIIIMAILAMTSVFL